MGAMDRVLFTVVDVLVPRQVCQSESAEAKK